MQPHKVQAVNISHNKRLIAHSLPEKSIFIQPSFVASLTTEKAHFRKRHPSPSNSSCEFLFGILFLLLVCFASIEPSGLQKDSSTSFPVNDFTPSVMLLSIKMQFSFVSHQLCVELKTNSNYTYKNNIWFP